MGQTIRFGRIAGVPVGANWSVVVMVGLIAGVLGAQVLPQMVPGQDLTTYWAVAIGGAVLFVAALLAHELAHAVAARRSGVPVRSITLWALGGVTELGDDPPSARTDLVIAVAGPAASLLAALSFGGIFLLVRAGHGPVIADAMLVWLAFTNGLLAVFNLLPGAPLDGGRILRAAVWMRHGDRARAAQVAATAGQVVGWLVAGLGLADMLIWDAFGGIWLILIGAFLITAATAEAAAEAAARALGGLRIGDIMTPNPATGAGWISVADFIEQVALHSAQTVFPVVGPDGALAGVAGLDRLSRLPAAARPVTLLRDIAYPVPPGYLARPGDLAASLHSRPPLAAGLVAVVMTGGRIVGLVTMQDLRQAIERARVPAAPRR